MHHLLSIGQQKTGPLPQNGTPSKSTFKEINYSTQLSTTSNKEPHRKTLRATPKNSQTDKYQIHQTNTVTHQNQNDAKHVLQPLVGFAAAGNRLGVVQGARHTWEGLSAEVPSEGQGVSGDRRQQSLSNV